MKIQKLYRKKKELEKTTKEIPKVSVDDSKDTTTSKFS